LTSFIDKENWQGCHFRIQICTIKKILGKKKETDHYTKLAAAKPYSPKNVDLLAYSSTLLEVLSTKCNLNPAKKTPSTLAKPYSIPVMPNSI